MKGIIFKIKEEIQKLIIYLVIVVVLALIQIIFQA